MGDRFGKADAGIRVEIASRTTDRDSVVGKEGKIGVGTAGYRHLPRQH